MSDIERPIGIHVAYHPTPYPGAMRADLEDIAGVCDGIYLPFCEGDLAYWSNKVKLCIDIAQDLDLIVLADFWGYGNIFVSGGYPSLFTIQRPEHNCVSNRGRAVPKSCPNKPAVRAFMKAAVEEWFEVYASDGVFWDEPQWALQGYLGALEDGEWLCRCPECQDAFEVQFNKPMPVDLTPEVETFRNDTMLGFLSELCGYVKACGEHLVTSTCVMPSDTPAFKAAVAKTQNLDIFGIDPYWRPNDDLSQKDYIDRHTGEAVALGKQEGKMVESWACAWAMNAGHEADAYRAAKLMARHDIDHLSAWSYRDYISWVPCTKPNQADPELVWQHLRRAFREIREGDVEVHL